MPIDDAGGRLTDPTGEEREAACDDARRRLAELRAVARALWPDRDDPDVLSELTAIVGAIRQAERQLKAADRAA